MIAPPAAARFRLVRYFTLASLAAFVLAVPPLLYFERWENALFKQAQQEQNAFFAQMQDSFVQRHDSAAHDYLLGVYEAGNVNLTRLFANALWEKDFAPFVAKAQRVPVDRCRAIADIKDAGGRTVQPGEKKACYERIGKQFMLLPEFRALDARMLDLLKQSTVSRIKVFDPRGITVYSSEHNQIGEDKAGNAAWESAIAGKPASQLTSLDSLSTFEGEAVDRDLISSYVPVRALGSERIAAVFEVYSDVTPFVAQIKSTSSQIQELTAASQAQMERAAAANHARVEANAWLQLAAIIGLLALLYLALLLIVRYGQRIIDKQDFEHKREQEALRAREERYRIILLTVMDGFWLADAQGRLLEVNETYSRMSGYSAQELLGMRVLDLEVAETADDTAAHIKKLMAQGEDRFESRHRRKDGSIFDVEISVQHRPAEGGHLVVFLRDITERKQAADARAQLEAQLRESQKMETIGTLAGGIAHDFNNALATILGNAELAYQDVSNNPSTLESLAEIRKAGARARTLVQQILSFSRRQPTERRRTALAPIIEETARLLRATLPARLALEIHCAADVPPVLADAAQIQQVLLNLATNAMQAIRGRPGRIVIRLNTVTLDEALADAHPALGAMHAKHPGSAVRIAVSDDGSGMDAATLVRIFEPFFTTKPVGEGTGLGLAVVHGIVQAHEGAIVVGSRPGKGTTFTLYLPAAEAQAVAPESDQSAAATVPALRLDGGRHILYLDDDESLVFLVQRLLERRGYRLSGYIDQAEALEALRADPAAFDLVVTDYNMPGMSGLDVAREVRAIRADLPVAVASGFIDEDLRALAGGAGVRELIFKAAVAEDLSEAFARLARTVGDKSKPA